MLNASFLLFTGKFQPCETAVWLPMAVSSRVLETIADEISVVIAKESDTGMDTIDPFSKKQLDCFYCIAVKRSTGSTSKRLCHPFSLKVVSSMI